MRFLQTGVLSLLVGCGGLPNRADCDLPADDRPEACYTMEEGDFPPLPESVDLAEKAFKGCLETLNGGNYVIRPIIPGDLGCERFGEQQLTRHMSMVSCKDNENGQMDRGVLRPRGHGFAKLKALCRMLGVFRAMHGPLDKFGRKCKVRVMPGNDTMPFVCRDR